MQLRNITFTKKQLEKVQVDQLLRKGGSAPTGPVQMEPKTMQVVSTMPTEHMVSTLPI
jgi:hypothetical protein